MKYQLINFVSFVLIMVIVIVLNKVFDWNLYLPIGTIVAIVYFYTAIKLLKK